jgi:hypothetical protein
VRSLVYTPDGKYILSSTAEGFRVLSGRSGATVHNIETGWEKITATTLSREGQLVAAAFHNNFVSIWALELLDVLGASAQFRDRPHEGQQEGRPLSEDAKGAEGVGLDG